VQTALHGGPHIQREESMKRWGIVAVILVLAGAASAQAQTQTWTIDSRHAAAHFAVRHLMVSTVRGDMGKVTGTVEFDPKNPAAAKIDATIDVTGLDTREPERDTHLKSADFFDVATYPTMTFKSKKVDVVAGGGFKMTGDLTLRGVTKEVVLDVEPLRTAIAQGANTKTGTTATAKINRQDFGVKWSRTMDGGGVVVGDEVSITIDVELTMPTAPKQ
jgi:polyisoprenoid-binding protein YceI